MSKPTMKSGSSYIGTSGWKYRHWDGVFYPSKLKKNYQLKFYTQPFNTVELNNSFYRQPRLQNFQEWEANAPSGFIFAVKANRYFTHLKKLNVERAEIHTFLDATKGLGDKMGPILFQLPPNWRINKLRLGCFLRLLPKTHRYSFEFRNPTWYEEDIFELLKEHNCAFCIYDLAGHQSPMTSTADFLYLRLHGPEGKYQGSYTKESLQSWGIRCKDWLAEKKNVFLYFDNDQAAHAPFNALEIKKVMVLSALENAGRT